LGIAAWLAACNGDAKPDNEDTDVDRADTDVAGDTDASADTDADTDASDTDVALDADHDGTPAEADCDDADADVHPGASERCNGVDDDCDPATGEDGFATWVGEDGTVRALDVEWGQGPVTLDAPGTVSVCTGEFPIATTITADTTFVGVALRDDDTLTGTGLRPADVGPAIVVSGGAALTLRTLTLSGTTGQRGVDCVEANVSLDDVSVVVFDQPAVDAESCGVSLHAVSLFDNAVDDGVIKVSHGTFDADGVTAARNSGRLAAVLRLSSLDARASLTDAEFRENSSGGGVVRLISADADFVAATFAMNTGQMGGGLHAEASDVTLTDSDLSNNTADDGGVVFMEGGSLTVTASGWTDNVATGAGGALASYDGSVTLLDGNTFDGNEAEDGGAIFLTGASLTTAGGHWNHNNASRHGGALYLTAAASLTAVDPQGWGNTSVGDGGFLYAWNADFDLDGADLQDNTAQDGGTVRVKVDDGGDYSGTLQGGAVADGVSYGNAAGLAVEASDGTFQLWATDTEFSGGASNLYGTVMLHSTGELGSVGASFTSASFLGTTERSISLRGAAGVSASGSGCDFPDVPLADIQLVDADFGFDLGLSQSFVCDASGCAFP
jgi:hypothetical protein